MRSIEPLHFWETFEGHFGTVVTLHAQFTHDLLAIAKFIVQNNKHSHLSNVGPIYLFIYLFIM